MYVIYRPIYKIIVGKEANVEQYISTVYFLLNAFLFLLVTVL